MKSCLPFSPGTRQGDPPGGGLFAVAHLQALRVTAAAHPDCIFPSLAHDTHIAGSPLAVATAYATFQAQLALIHLEVKPAKCVAFLPSGLPVSFPVPDEFVVARDGIRALGVHLRFAAFVSTFARERLGKCLLNVDLLP